MRAVAGAIVLGLAGATAAAAAEPTTFSVDYVVRVSARDPGHARVRWLLAGIDEIRSFRLVFRDDRTTGVRGTGRLAWDGATLRWTPGRPYAHLSYRVRLDHRRPPARFDSHAGPDWVATRALHLFPEINVDFRPGAAAARARARLLFRLPAGWRSVAAGAPLGRDVFRVEEPGKRFDRPRGWILLGRVARRRQTVAGTRITVATAPGSALDVRRLLRLYRRTVPLLAAMLAPAPDRVLVVSAPDPMWRGGISGEDSFFVHGRIPLRSPDRTSTYLHELFHVWQPLRPGRDGRWISEGLAEYYALELQRRAGALSARGFARGVALLARHGRFGVDLSKTDDPAALNNSAALIMHRLDTEIDRATAGRHRLDDVVRTLARQGGPLTTASLLRAVNRTAGRDFTAFFRRHVYRGEAPAAPRAARARPSAGTHVAGVGD